MAEDLLQKVAPNQSSPGLMWSITDRAERFFDALGLMSGWVSPFLRGSFAFLVVSLFEKAFPGLFPFAFQKDGSVRDWAFFTNRPGSTLIPWWMLPLLAAMFVGLFV